MESYKTSSQLKARAKDLLHGNYMNAVLLIIVVQIITSLLTSVFTFFIPAFTVWGTILTTVITFFISIFCGIFSFGVSFFFLKLCCGQPCMVDDVFYGFKYQTKKVIEIQFVFALMSLLYTLPTSLFNSLFMATKNVLWIAPYFLWTAIGLPIIVFINLMLSQSLFLLLDFPQFTAKEALMESVKLMKGHKGRLFYLNISFFPLLLLSIFSCGIGMFWVLPYQNTTLALFFLDLMKHRNNSQTA